MCEIQNLRTEFKANPGQNENDRFFEIDVKGLSFSYRNDGGHSGRTLYGIDFHAHKGECVGIIGANGVGKSTFLKILVGLLDGFDGKINIGGLELNKKNLSDIRRMTGYVFQDSENQLFMSTVYEDVAFAPQNYGYSPQQTEERVNMALSQMGIEDLRDGHTFMLSGGQKKLAAIASIISMTPEIILMDEPTIALDPRNRKNLIRVINSFSQLRIIASHDLDMIQDTCTRVVLMNNGRFVREGSADEILNNRQLLEENGLELPLGSRLRQSRNEGNNGE